MATLKKTLGRFDGIALLVGITIGSGIFATPQIIAKYLNSFSTIILLWIAVSIFVYVGALIYAELGSRFPETGGEYIYIEKAFGSFWGFIFGWTQLFIIRTSATAGLSLVTANYLSYFFPMNQIEKTLVAFLVIIVFCTINYLGVKKASTYNKLSSSTKIGGLLLFAVIGLLINGNDFSRLGEIKTVEANLGPIGNTIAALMLILFSFIGWDRVGYVAGEMKDPQKVISQTMLFGMLIISVLYLSSNVLYHTIIGLEQMRESTIVASDTAVQLFGPIGAAIISLMVIISATGSINGTIMSASRVYYAMAKDKLLFAWLDNIHPKYQTPTHAIIAHGLWAAVLIIIRQNFETIISGMVFAVLIFYGLTTIAFFKFRNENAGKDNGYKLFGYPWIPAIYLFGIVLLVMLRSFYEFESSAKDLCFIISGIPIYFILFKNQPAK